MTSRFMGNSIEVRPEKWLLGFIFLEEGIEMLRVKLVIFPSYAGWILKQLRITVRTGIPIHVSFS